VTFFFEREGKLILEKKLKNKVDYIREKYVKNVKGVTTFHLKRKALANLSPSEYSGSSNSTFPLFLRVEIIVFIELAILISVHCFLYRCKEVSGRVSINIGNATSMFLLKDSQFASIP